MGPSTTPFASRDTPAPPPPRRGRPEPLSPRRLLILFAKVVLGVAGFAGFALLGAGGALLIKHLLTSGAGAGASTVNVAPMAGARPAPPPPASPATPPAVPTRPVQVAASPALAAAAPVAATGPGDAAIEAPAPTAQLSQRPASSHGSAKPPRGVDSEGSATSARADKAGCMATVNAITADLSLRNEPPTPQQLAILKRGCK